MIPSSIFFSRNRFKMIRINARLVPAKMINLLIFRNLTFIKTVRVSMSLYPFKKITVGGYVPLPLPASSPCLLDQSQKTLMNRNSRPRSSVVKRFTSGFIACSTHFFKLLTLFYVIKKRVFHCELVPAYTSCSLFHTPRVPTLGIRICL